MSPSLPHEGDPACQQHLQTSCWPAHGKGEGKRKGEGEGEGEGEGKVKVRGRRGNRTKWTEQQVSELLRTHAHSDH